MYTELYKTVRELFHKRAVCIKMRLTIYNTGYLLKVLAQSEGGKNWSKNKNNLLELH